MIARAIHKHSQRSGQAFISVNCASILLASSPQNSLAMRREHLLARFSEDKAVLSWRTPERFFSMKSANCPRKHRSHCLRVLQERQFERVGGNRLYPNDARVIAATTAI